MGRACAEENERMSKMGGELRRQCPRVNEVSSGIAQLVKPLAEQLSALGEQMKEVHSEMLPMKKEGKHPRNKSKCEACTQNEINSADIASNAEKMGMCPEIVKDRSSRQTRQTKRGCCGETASSLSKTNVAHFKKK